MKYRSLEVRWFAGGPAPPDWKRWLAAGDSLPEGSERTDLYLLGAPATLNIKLREGRVEVKQRQGTPRLLQLDDRHNGWEEKWVKWSFGLEATEDYVQAAAGDPASWLPVGKKRYLRIFTMQNGHPQEKGTEEYPEVGCGVELTEVTVGHQSWHTVGFEAFGENLPRRQLFDATLRALLTTAEAPVLLRAQSRGYAAWMSEFHSKMIREDTGE